MRLVVEPRDLPIPARARQFELRIAELAGAGASLLSGLGYVGDDGAQINVEASFEYLFRFASVVGGEKNAGDNQHDRTHRRRRQEQTRGDGAKGDDGKAAHAASAYAGVLCRRGRHVAQPAHGLDQIDAKLLAQPADEDFDRVRVAIESPDRINVR